MPAARPSKRYGAGHVGASGATRTSGLRSGPGDSKVFIEGCRKLKVTPHVAASDRHSAVDARITRHEGLKTSQEGAQAH